MKLKPTQLKLTTKLERAQQERRSRLLVLLLLMFSLLPSLILAFWAQWRDQGFSWLEPKLKLSFLISEKETKKDLTQRLDHWAQTRLPRLPGQWAIRIELLNQNFSWGVNDQIQFQAASLIKLPVVAAFYHQVAQGEIDLKEVYFLRAEDKVKGAGSLQYQSVGTKWTLEQLAQLALSQSDNTAFKILRQRLSDQLIEQLITAWGLEQTDLEDNLTSAKDIAYFFRQLYKHQLLDPPWNERVLTDLTETIFEDRLPAGVPEGIRVAHKVGTETGVVSDAGIVFTPGRPFILVILSQATKNQIAERLFPQLVNELYWLLVEADS